MGLGMQGPELERYMWNHNVSGKQNPFHSFVVLKIWWGSLGKLSGARPELVNLRWWKHSWRLGERKRREQNLVSQWNPAASWFGRQFDQRAEKCGAQMRKTEERGPPVSSWKIFALLYPNFPYFSSYRFSPYYCIFLCPLGFCVRTSFFTTAHQKSRQLLRNRDKAIKEQWRSKRTDWKSKDLFRFQ